MRLIVTNNKKVEGKYTGRAEVRYLKDMSAVSVLHEARKVAAEGGKLMVDPTKLKGYYRSLPFFVDKEAKEPDEKSLTMIDFCIEQAKRNGNTEDNSQEPLLSGILQNKDLGLVSKILG
jgi:hypothetical protein